MSHPSKEKSPTSDFNNLVRNGIDFLKKAITQLDQDPKHSVINFHTAVEIFLKAPLVHEHWSLVVVDRDPNRLKYEAGDFLSVSFVDACNRLDKSLNKPLLDSTKEAFDKIRKHRNRMVHFYHSGLDGKQRDEIKLEQARAWFELNRFVSVTWNEIFQSFSSDFSQMERNLISNNHYAKAKYEDLKPKIEGLKTEGSVFEICPKCETEAYRFEEKLPRLITRGCMVCFKYESLVLAKCPNCKEPDQCIRPYDGFECNNCGHKISIEIAIFNLLDQSRIRGTKHDLDSNTPAMCGECQGYDTVCEYEGSYLCSKCLTCFDSIGYCEWCSTPMTGSTEDTYVFGCPSCEGLSGHHAND